MMPTPPSDSTPAAEPVADWVHTNRSAFGTGLAVIAVVCLVIAGYCGYRGFAKSTPPADGETPAVIGKTVGELDPMPFRIICVTAALAALAVGATAGYLLGTLPSPVESVRRFHDRMTVLVAGGAFGLANVLCGGLLFFIWFNKLGDWINGVAGAQKTAWMPVVALLQFLLGAGVVFLAAIPARGEERNSTLARRLVYGTNLGVSVLLLIVGLVVTNVLVTLKLPAKLDTTSTGFYTLSDQTREYIAGLKQDVKVYAITAEGGGRLERIQADALRLLTACAEINPQRFQVKTLSPVYDRNEIATLTAKYPDANLRAFGVLLTTGDNFDRRGYIEFEKMAAPGPNNRDVFKGEAELIRELMFRTERESVAYFTQSARELQLERSGDTNTAAGRTAFRLKDDLDKSRCVAKPLRLNPLDTDPKIPDDADLVVVVDPLNPLPDNTVAALRKYLTGDRPGGKKGRLLVFSGARPSSDGKAVLKTGLEPLLESFGILMMDRAIYSRPSDRVPVEGIVARSDRDQQDRRNPVAVLLRNGLRTVNTRPVAPMPGQPGGAVPRLLMHTDGSLAWLEPTPIDPPIKAWQELKSASERGDRKYLAERSPSEDPITLAAFATDKDGSPVVAAFGFAEGLGDDAPTGQDGRSIMSKVLTTAVDWLRERPPAPDIAPKNYDEYIPPKTVNSTHIFYVPVVSMLLGIVLLGLGVWVYRRK